MTEAGKTPQRGRTPSSLLAAAFARMARAVASAALALFAFAAAQPARAAQTWSGNTDSNFSNSANWSGNGSGRRYIRTSTLTGNKLDLIYLTKNVTEKTNTGLCFQHFPERGYWRFQGQNQYAFDNSGNTGTDYDQDLVCIGYGGTDSAARFYAITLKTRHLTVGGDANLGKQSVQYNMTGHLVLDDLNDDADGYLGPVNITATRTCDFFRGDLYATNANITCKGNMTFYNFTAEKTGGDWTLTGDFIVGAMSGASATFTQKGGTTTIPSGKWTKSTGGAGTVNLDGGTFTTYHIKDDSGSLAVNFNGGTLKAHPDGVRQGELMAHGSGAGLAVNVGEGGGTIDTSGHDFSVGVAVNAVSGTAGAFSVTGGGSATFPEMGSLTGALAVGDATTLHWFDQDATVSTTCAFTSLALGAGSTIYIDGNATALDALPATVTTTATAENKATVEIAFSAIPAAGTSFTLFPAASADAFDVMPRLGGLELPHETAIENGSLVLTITAEDYTWNGTQTNWSDAGAWTKSGASATWADGNNAIFNTSNATAALASDASPAELRFAANAAVSGTATLTVPSVSVLPDVAAAINAPTAGALQKTGAGTLTLGSSRADQTTLSEGTLAMANGATVDASKLTLGTDAAKPVVFDYGGQTLTAAPASYLATGMDVTLTNGVFAYDSSIDLYNAAGLPASLTVARGAALQTSNRFAISSTNGVASVINIPGGTVKSTANNNNWIMQRSHSGRLDINVTDGGLLEFGGETYFLTCRDDADIYESPELHVKVVDSTFRVANGKSLRLGLDADTRASATPVFTLAATNSVFDIGYAIYLGNNKTGLATAGSYTAEFNNCVVATKAFRVYSDRPLNNALFDGSTITFNAASGAVSAPDADAKWITVAAGGLTLDTDGNAASLGANLGGAGTVTKTGDGTLTVAANQTSAGGFALNEGTLAFANTCTTFSRALSAAAGTTIDVADGNILAPASLTLPAEGTVSLTKGGAAFAKGVHQIFSGVSAETVQGKLVPSTGGEEYSWSVENGILLLNVGNLAGNVWTGLAADGLMSTDGNWLDGTAPIAGEAIDFGSVSSATEITADVDATFGAVTMGTGVITFSGSFAATSISDTSMIAVAADSTVTLNGDLTLDESNAAVIVNKVDAGGAFIVTGTIRSATGQSTPPVAVAGGGCIVANGIEIPAGSSLYSTLDVNTQTWAIGPGGITAVEDGTFWCMSNKANDSWIHPYTNDFTVSAWTVVRSAIDHHELNTTGYGDGQPHTITLDAGFSDNGKVYIGGAGKVVVNHVPTGAGDKAAYSGAVTVQDTATLAINAGKQLTTGKTTFAAGTTLEVPSTGVTMGAIAFSGTGTVALKVSDASLPDGDYALVTSSSDLPEDFAARFAVEASTESETCLVADGRTLRLFVGSREAAGLCVWTGKTGGGDAGTEGNWLAGATPVAGADVFIAAGGTIANLPAGFAPSSITFGYGIEAVEIEGENAIEGVTEIVSHSSASHTINVPVYFTGDIQVKQAAMAEVGDLAKAHITFAGGAYAAEGYAIENANSAAVYSRCMFGKYHLANAESNPWTATVQGTNKRLCLAAGSTLHIPYAGDLKELYVDSGAQVYVGPAAIDGAGRVSYKNFGEIAVDSLTASGTGDKYMSYNQGTSVAGVFKFETVTNSMTGNWCYFADGNAASRGVFYIGAGGLNIAAESNGKYCIGRDLENDAQTIRPWHSDFTIGSLDDSAWRLVLTRDVTFCTDDESGAGRTITVDAITRGYGTSPTVTVSGSGTLRVNKAAQNTAEPTVAVTDSATLAFGDGASLGTGDTAVGSGATLAVAQPGVVTIGGNLTLAAGAALEFSPSGGTGSTLAVASGKTLSISGSGTVTVKFANRALMKPGQSYTLLAGADLADASQFALESGDDGTLSVSGGDLVYTAPRYFTIRIANAGAGYRR